MFNTYVNINENDVTHVPNDNSIYTSIYNDIIEFNNINYIINNIIVFILFFTMILLSLIILILIISLMI